MSFQTKTVEILPSAYRIYPYALGDCEPLEKKLKIWDKKRFKYSQSLFVYDEKRNVLTIPRGVGKMIIEKALVSSDYPFPNFEEKEDHYAPVRKVSVKMKAGFEPRDNIQKGATEFLEKEKNKQKVVTLDTGFGKSFCSIYHAVNKREVTLVIVKGLVDQWIEKFLTMYTDQSIDEGIIRVVGSPVIDKIMDESAPRGVFYVASTNTLSSYMKRGGNLQDFINHIGVGIKIIDELHENFYQNVLVDIGSQVKSTIYLSATLGRSDPIENFMFKRIYSRIPTYGESTHSIKQYYNVRKIIYDTKALPHEIQYCTIKEYGFSTKRYFKYVGRRKQLKLYLYGMMKKFIIKTLTADPMAKILIIVDNLKLIELFHDLIENDMKVPTGLLCSLVPESSRENEIKENIVILSTPKSGSTGKDITGLRVILSMTTFRSFNLTRQLLGRLRRIEGKKVYFLDFCDNSFPSMIRHQRERMKIIQPKSQSLTQEYITMEEALGESEVKWNYEEVLLG